MSYTLIFDTETTGLPKKRRVSALESPDIWPDLVSICWHLYKDKQLVSKEHAIIKPQGWTIPAESVKFHGITTEIATEKGRPLAEVLGLFLNDLLVSQKVIAHNLEFDKNVLLHAWKWRLNVNPSFWPVKAEFCSCDTAKWELKLRSLYPTPKDPYQMPSLDYLYEDTFKVKAPGGAHSADRDVDVLQQIVWKRWFQ